MRTVILVGFIYLGDHINPSYNSTERVIAFYAILLLIVAIMDITDFIKNLFRKK